MKIFAILIGIVVIGLGGFFLFGQTQAPAVDESANDADASMMMKAEGDAAEKAADSVADTAGAADGAADGVVNIEITGKNFSYNKSEIVVKAGDKVKITFTSEDGFHDWVVDEFKAATEKVNTGGTTSVEFVADKAGTYEYYCSVGKHRENGMVGKLIVQ